MARAQRDHREVRAAVRVSRRILRDVGDRTADRTQLEEVRVAGFRTPSDRGGPTRRCVRSPRGTPRWRSARTRRSGRRAVPSRPRRPRRPRTRMRSQQPPAPRPRSNRPPLSRSRLAADRAMTAGGTQRHVQHVGGDPDAVGPRRDEGHERPGVQERRLVRVVLEGDEVQARRLGHLREQNRRLGVRRGRGDEGAELEPMSVIHVRDDPSPERGIPQAPSDQAARQHPST